MRETIHHSPQEWITGLKNQDQHIVREFYERAQRPFISWARRHFHQDRDAASDSFQETMLAFLGAARRGKLDVCENNRTLQSLFFSLGRRIVRRSLAEQPHWMAFHPEEHYFADEPPPARYRERKLYRVFAKLPARYRHILQWHHVEAIPQEEIAARLGLQDVVGVRILLHKAQKELKRLFREEPD